ncbi:uncharacterized protein PHALS_01273 [Plasmopara halstedii]|uniref:RxLR-like protein n=1 Tax=Plasmopara halstedii TaxID=4781 RepID=A0A0P1ASK1_PLAHL|nr:uncharacterized protein PHALS_01273 [Plasmopara halstedii]CEG44950.1 hypothetical protein PHALS_01273 [Plasmopara halstedii]|eukprot:XP_024581319.1 hypothetical protein PHALS_01273 [Plasmopara halstedii]
MPRYVWLSWTLFAIPTVFVCCPHSDTDPSASNLYVPDAGCCEFASNLGSMFDISSTQFFGVVRLCESFKRCTFRDGNDPIDVIFGCAALGSCSCSSYKVPVQLASSDRCAMVLICDSRNLQRLTSLEKTDLRSYSGTFTEDSGVSIGVRS